ncbi:MAG: hypothetical protein ACKOFM_04430, partial [Actinomycetota bacterium]
DKNQNVLRVSARHELSAEPAYRLKGEARHKIVSWAGPWPVEEKWWDIARSRRLVRLQLVVEKNATPSVGAGGNFVGSAGLVDPAGSVGPVAESSEVRAMLVALEHGQWSIVAIYG